MAVEMYAAKPPKEHFILGADLADGGQVCLSRAGDWRLYPPRPSVGLRSAEYRPLTAEEGTRLLAEAMVWEEEPGDGPGGYWKVYLGRPSV